jgi:hypothetical protein
MPKRRSDARSTGLVAALVAGGGGAPRRGLACCGQGLERRSSHRRGPLLGPYATTIVREWRCGEKEEASEEEWMPRPPDAFVGHPDATTKNVCRL